MTTEKKPTPRGRPVLPEDQRRTEVIRLRATKAEKQNYRDRGGDDWLRAMLSFGPRKNTK